VRRRAWVVGLLLGLPVLLWLDGWVAIPGLGAPGAKPPEALRQALADVARDLATRAEALARDPEVARSLAGGGIAVRRQALFSAARRAMEGAPAGSWIALADPGGNVHAWWGDAPAVLLEIRAAGTLAARWSATRLELLHWRAQGQGDFAAVICAARSLPVEAPAFGAGLGLTGRNLAWAPAAPGDSGDVLLRAQDGMPLVVARPVSGVPDTLTHWRDLAVALLLAIALWLVGRAADPRGAGGSLALAFLSWHAYVGGGDRSLASSEPWILAFGIAILPPALAAMRREGRRQRGVLPVLGAFALFALAIHCVRSVSLPELGTPFPAWGSPFVSLLGAVALMAAALALGASGQASARGSRTGIAVAVSVAAVVLALALVTSSRWFPIVVMAAAFGVFETWRRCLPVGTAGGGAMGPFRLLVAGVLLLLLVATPLHEHETAVRAFRVASAIQLPDPERISAATVVAVRRAVDRVEQFDLGRELPAPLEHVDLSDLAYRLWREGEERAPSSSLIAYEVYGPLARLRSRFSLIPEGEGAGPPRAGTVHIERHSVAVVRRAALLSDAGVPWGRVVIAVADWPSWDPLPPRLEVYRRLVGGEPPPEQWPRPVLGVYGPDGSKRQDGPDLPAATLSRLRRTGKPVRVRLRFRGEELRGEVRPGPEGFDLIAIPGPDFLKRLLAAALLLPVGAALYALGLLVVLWRILLSGRTLKALFPPGARTFRGRLLALFVLSVMIPLFSVTFFLRSSIETRSRQDTLAHARTALETTRRVLDDYLPTAAVARGRLGLLDDALLSWLANAVGYDLSVYGPDARLVATSRRDLYAAGLLPERVPGATFVTVGLGEARERPDARLIAGSRFEEITTALSAVPGVPGVRSPVLLSLLLLPQQRVAEAEAAQLTAAVSAFSLLVFLVSAAIAGRLAVRVARPVADLVEGTRAVARGDFSPRLAEPPDEELRELVRAFLFMSRSLREQTDALSREKERLATLLSQLTAGVVAYRDDGSVLLANPAAARLGRGSASGTTLEEVFPGETMRGVRTLLERAGARQVSEELEPRAGERWRVVAVPLPLGGAGTRMAVIEDVSDVVRSNRLAAWAEMARIIAHEIKNPLTPIRLSVEHLREVWRRKSPDFEHVLEECAENVLRQTDELRRSAAEFSDYARLPGPEMRPTDIGNVVREAAAAYAGATGIRWVVDAEPGLYARADARLLTRLLSNLIGNSVEAVEGRGEIRLTARSRDGSISVIVEDDGPGVAPEILPRLFDPYFSARSGGTGLGLAIAKKIVEEHGGTIGAEARAEGGFRVCFALPVIAPSEGRPA
jgi:signal transduction histidine kinase/HAMP domain-containing protein